MPVCRASNTLRSVFLAALAAAVLSPARPSLAATITVTGTGDSTTVDTFVTLREAIISINNGADLNADVTAHRAGTYGTSDTINFGISGSGLHTIVLVGVPLDTITKPVVINGFSQSGASPNSNATGALNPTYTIEIDGSGAGAGAGGIFNVSGGSTTIRGLVVNRGGGGLNSGIRLVSSNNHIEGNFIGTDATGTLTRGNASHGVLIAGGSGNFIGGDTPDTRNLISGLNGGDGLNISGPASSTTVRGNLIGTNAAGTAALGNNLNGVAIFNSPNNTIGGTAAGAGNVIAANGSFGLAIFDSLTTGTTVQGNRIGTNAAGTAALANALGGVDLRGAAHGNTIGGTTAGARNVISGNANFGIQLLDVGVDSNVIQGNFIGTGADGTSALGNSGFGILASFVSFNTIGGTAAGAGNTVAFNTGDGVSIGGTSSNVQNAILGNSIYSNGGFGIVLGGNPPTANDHCDGDSGSNNLQNYPVITSVTAGVGTTNIQGTLDSTASTGPFRIEFFSSPSCDTSGFGEGKTFLGSTTVTTDANCAASFNATLSVTVSVNDAITATATDPNNNTSEFSQCFIVGVGVTPSNTPTFTPTFTPTNTFTVTQTPTNTPTLTPTSTGTITFTFTPTITPTATVTPTATNTATATSTQTVTPTFTLTPTGTITPPTNTPTLTPTNSPTNTPTFTVTPTGTITPPTNTPTPTVLLTATPTPVQPPTATPTQTGGGAGAVVPTLSPGMLALLGLALAAAAVALIRRL